jgi:cell wall-associated NlpC family hydrolase
MPAWGHAAQVPGGTPLLSRYVLGDDPAPPTEAQIQAAAAAVSGRAAALQRQQDQLGTANARLTELENQAETLTERYDQVVLDEQQAAAAYRQAETRLQIADAAQRLADQQVAAQAAADFENGGGAGQLAAMIGDPHGPQQYLNVAALENLLQQHGTEMFVARRADGVVAGVFRQQAHDLLVAEQAAAERAATQQAAGQQAVAQQATDQVGEPDSGTQWALSSGASAEQGNIAADWALSQLGKPYQWGGAGPGTYDCSGLTMRAWERAGVELGHWTGWQWESGPHVPLDDLQRGDLLFFATNTSDPETIHHVGIYIGNGMMVDAPYTGAYVRIDSMYQPGGLIGATRPAA